MRLDHVSYACTNEEIGDVVQRLGSALGGTFTDGGRHPRFGTRNFILPLAAGTYLEVVAALEHPAADKAPFGQAVRRRCGLGGGWLGWVVAVPDLAPYEQRLGRAAVPGNRVRPDGVELRWHQIGILDVLDDPQLPFFTHWEVEPALHPSATASDAIAIHGLQIAGDPVTLARWLGEPADHPLEDIDVTWTTGEDGGSTGLSAVVFQTSHGLVRID
ncbi:MAG: VOC family protein [Actinomycetota bacterium]|nr:MAG: VOC family protein [Actinomycetota bacterium]